MDKITVAHVCLDNTNVAYSYSYLMNKFNIESTIFQPKIPNTITSKIHYGYESGNPLNISMKYLSNSEIIRAFEILGINNRFDIVHLHDGAGILGAVVSGMGTARVVYHFHGSVIREGLPTFTLPIRLRKMYWRYFGLHSKTIVSTADLLEHWRGSELILDPIDPMIFKTERFSGVPYILSPHRCDDDIKGTFMVFSAWDMLKEFFPELTLIVINWGKDAEYYKNQTKDDPSVHWLEPVTRTEYINLLSGATILWGQFIIPAYGLSEVEAIAMGVPIISDPDITESELADFTKKLIQDDTLRSVIIDKQREKILDYNSDVIAKKIYDMYVGVLK